MNKKRGNAVGEGRMNGGERVYHQKRREHHPLLYKNDAAKVGSPRHPSRPIYPCFLILIYLVLYLVVYCIQRARNKNEEMKADRKVREVVK